MAYEERYCAFVDILGFSELVTGLRSGLTDFDAIRAALKKIREPHDSRYVGTGDTGFQANSISDAVAFSTLPTPRGLSVLLAKLKALSVALLHQGFFTRGAVCRGLLHQDEHMVFGEALVKAYALESTVAKYPRIVITKDVVEDAFLSDMSKDDLAHFKKAKDGPHYLHVLWTLQMMLEVRKENPAHEGIANDWEFFDVIQSKIEMNFDDTMDTPRRFKKARWFANYWNETVDPVTTNRVMHIERPGLKSYFPAPIDYTRQ